MGCTWIISVTHAAPHAQEAYVRTVGASTQATSKLWSRPRTVAVAAMPVELYAARDIRSTAGAAGVTDIARPAPEYGRASSAKNDVPGLGQHRERLPAAIAVN